jgi:hypothetical protein
MDSIFRPELVAQRVLTAPDAAEAAHMTKMAYILSGVASGITFLWMLIPVLFSSLILMMAGDLFSLPRFMISFALGVVGSLAGIYAVLHYAEPALRQVFTQLGLQTGFNWIPKLMTLLPYHMAGGAAIMVVLAAVPVLGLLAGLGIGIYSLIRWWHVYRDATQLELPHAIVGVITIFVVQAAPGWALGLVEKILF